MCTSQPGHKILPKAFNTVWKATGNRLGYRMGQQRQEGRVGRPCADDRDCFEGILWIVLSGLAGRGWHNLPDRYPSAPTCWRRLTEWQGADVWLERVWRALREDTAAAFSDPLG